MAFSTGGGGGPQTDINVTPLVDVVLVLLIIFMVVTPLLQVGIDADIPKPQEDQPIEQTPPDLKQVIVQVKEDGSIWLNADKVTEEQLKERVSATMKRRYQQADKLAFLSGTDNLQFARVVRVMDILRGAGVANIGIIDPIPTS